MQSVTVLFKTASIAVFAALMHQCLRLIALLSKDRILLKHVNGSGEA
jgi:hypothetical protein